MFRREFVLAFVVIAFSVFVSFPAPSQPMPPEWSKSFGDAVSQAGTSIAVDATGNIFVLGQFAGTVDFGGGALTSAGSTDIFLVKFDASGTHLWSKSFGDADVQSSEAFKCVAVDGAGNVVVTGRFKGTIDFGGGALASAGDYDIFLAKFDASGTHLWSNRFGDAEMQNPSSVAFDGTGDIILTGAFKGAVNFGGGALTSAGDYDIFLAKFDASGTYLWSKRFGDASSQGGVGEFDSAGNIIIAGSFRGTVDFGGGAITSAGDNDVFLAKFDAAGTHQWSERFGSASYSEGCWNLIVDHEEHIIISGYGGSSLDFGGGALPDTANLYLAKFDDAGTHLWSNGFVHQGLPFLFDAAVDGRGNIVLSGAFQNGIDFGGGVLENAGYYDIYLAKFNSSGTYLWSQRFGGTGGDYGYGVTVDGTGDIIMTGGFEGTVDFGGGALTSAGSGDVFLVKFLRTTPEILTILDIPNDQGKQVRISWLGSGYDSVGSPTPITGYSIYRKIDYGLTSSRAFELSDRGEPLRAYPPGDWDFIVTVPARAEEEYFTVVPTLADSTIADGMYYTTFFVSALTGTPGTYYDSAPDSGYSVDNLSPAKPGGFAVAYNTGSGNQLSWDESEDEDFAHYCIYRGSTPDFTPSAENRVDVTLASGWTDPEHDGWNVYYKITAVDFSGNESDPASSSTVTGTDGASIPMNHGLYQNVPNPFNPRTTISFDLKEKADVSLVVYDPSGRLVRVLVSGRLQAQRYQVVWDGMDAQGRSVASGVYFFRLKAGKDVFTRKAILLR